MSIEVQFVAHDEGSQEILDAIRRFPEWSVERAELEAFLFTTLARVSYREADRRRAAERQRLRREAKRQAREATT